MFQAFDGKLVVGATLSGDRQVVEQAYEVSALSRQLDLMNIMTYDLHGFWDTRAAHHAPLYAADSDQSVVSGKFIYTRYDHYQSVYAHTVLKAFYELEIFLVIASRSSKYN